MERQVLKFGFLLFLTLTTENYGAPTPLPTEAGPISPPTCDTNQIEDITKRDDVCAEILRAQWNNKKTTMCNDFFHRRLCCKLCKSNPRKKDLHWDIAKMMQEYYEVHQMKYRDVYYNKTMIIYTGVKPAITNANAKPALNR
uniref:Uncharacterized protein LOC111101354 n=1 Tax=Crassostrea virginica TaxID=6565 RepID=A0A8B8AHP0_CRAVI|nr:uncharacterized protein LOC111101354 [Crassostrea virginica]